MTRSLNPAPFTSIANDPNVRPWLGGCGELDLAAWVTNPDNLCLLTPCQQGAYLYIKQHPGLYAVHTLAKPSARGRPMLRLMHEGLEALFISTDAVEVGTLVPDGNEAASKWAALAGFRELYRRENFFPLQGRIVGASFRSLTYGDWVLSSKRCRDEGAAFHAMLPHVTHAEDPVHDAFVGATALGCLAGNPVKAIALYNRFASHAGYMNATVLGLNPLLVHTGDALVGMVDGRLEIVDSGKPSLPIEFANDGEAVSRILEET